MFSPQSVALEQFNNDNNNPSVRISDLSDNDDECINNSNDNIVYTTEDLNINGSKTSASESTVSYCGIKSNSNLSAILNICSSCIGVGCLAFPYLFANMGIITSIIIHLIVSLSIYYTLNLLRSFVVDTKYFSYSSMTERILGKKWLMIYSFSSFIYYLSVNINYKSLLYSLFESSFVSHSKFYGFVFLLLTCSMEIFLCLYTSKTSKINLLSLITMFNYTLIILITVFEGIRSSVVYDYFPQKISKKNLFSPRDDEGKIQKFFSYITSLIKYIYAYCYHCSFPTLIDNLKNVDDSNSKKVHNVSFIIISISYLLIGFFGYLIKKNVPTLLFREYEDTNDKGLIVLKFILFIFLFSLIPSRYIIIIDGYTSLIGKGKLTYKKDLLITTLSLIISNVIVFLNEELWVYDGQIQIDIFSIMVYIFGGLFGVFISFGLPVINYAAANGKKKVKALIGYALTGLYFIVGLLSFGYSFYEIFIIDNNEEDEF